MGFRISKFEEVALPGFDTIKDRCDLALRVQWRILVPGLQQICRGMAPLLNFKPLNRSCRVPQFS